MRRRLMPILVLLGLVMNQVACAADAEVVRILTREVDGEFLLDAEVAYDLGGTIEEALLNGVPLVFVVHLEVRRSDAWFWDADLVEQRLLTQIRFRPLAEHYEVKDLATGDVKRFATQQAALATVGMIRGLRIISRSELEPQKPYQLNISAYLDVEALPLPLRPLAHISSGWKLASDQEQWPLTP